MPTMPLVNDDQPRLAEAYENLRHIREVMDRSTRHSTLSGLSGLLVGLWAIAGVLATHFIVYDGRPGVMLPNGHLWMFGAIWLAVLGVSAVTDYLLTKRR